MLTKYKLKFYLLLFLIINIASSTYCQANLYDSSCTKCEEKIRKAMQDWKKMIFNHDDIAPVSFVKLFKVDNEETRKLVLAKFTDDTTFAGIFYWDSDGEKIKLVRQGEYFGKKITTLIGGNIARAHFPTKKDKETIKNYLEEIASCYEVVYKNRETTVSIPVLYFKAGYIIDPVLSTSQFSNYDN